MALKTDDGGFAASLTAAAAASGDETDATANVPAADVVDDAGEPAPGGADDSDPLDDADDADGQEADGEDSGEVPDLGVIGKQFTDGDIKGACAALGIDPKILGVNVPKLEAMRRGLKEARDRDAAAATKLAQAETEKTNATAIVKSAKEQYGFAVDLKQAIAAGDFYAVKELCEQLAPRGTTWEVIATGIVKAARGESTSEVMYRRELKRIREEEAARVAAAEATTAAATAAATSAEIQQRNVVGATAKLKGTEYDGIPEAAETLAKIVADSYDAKRGGFTLTLAQALAKLKEDKIVAKLVKLARLEKRAPAADAAPPRAATGQFVQRTRVVKAPGAKTADTAEARRAADFAKSIEAAARAEDAAASRGAGRRGRK